MPTASPMPPLTVLESSLMKPSAVTVYLTSSSLTLEVLTVTNDWSRSMSAIGAAEDARVEDDVAVHPQHAALAGRGEGAQQALGRVGLVVAVVVDVVDVGEGLDDRLGAVADDGRDAGLVAEGGTDVVVLLLHDAAAVAELGQRLRQAAAEARAHAGCEDDGLKSQGLLLECVDSSAVHRRDTPSCRDHASESA